MVQIFLGLSKIPFIFLFLLILLKSQAHQVKSFIRAKKTVLKETIMQIQILKKIENLHYFCCRQYFLLELNFSKTCEVMSLYRQANKDQTEFPKVLETSLKYIIHEIEIYPKNKPSRVMEGHYTLGPSINDITKIIVR